MTIAEAAGVGIPEHRLRSREFRRAAWGIYMPATVPLEDPDVRIAVAAHRRPPGVAIGGWAAARRHEAALRARSDDLTVFDGVLPEMEPGRRTALPVLVCAPHAHRIARRPGCDVYRSDLDEDEIVVVDGTPVTSPLRTAFDLARLWPLLPAVVALDRLAHLGAVEIDDVAALLRRRSGWRGVARAARAVALADRGAESPRESMVRMLWVQAGLGRPRANVVVRDRSGAFVARVDLMDPAAGVVGEYDGAVHAPAGHRRADARRQELLEDVGLVVVRANEPDMAGERARSELQHRLRMGYRRASLRAGARGWVVD